MKKASLLNLLKQIKADAELKEIENGTILKILMLLVQYINDSDIEEAVNDIPA